MIDKYLWQDAIFDSGLDSSTKLVALALLWRANRKTGVCNPSYTTLANDTSMCRRTMVRKISELTEVGILTPSRGNGKANQYRFNDAFLDQSEWTDQCHHVTEAVTSMSPKQGHACLRSRDIDVNEADPYQGHTSDMVSPKQGHGVTQTEEPRTSSREQHHNPDDFDQHDDPIQIAIKSAAQFGYDISVGSATRIVGKMLEVHGRKSDAVAAYVKDKCAGWTELPAEKQPKSPGAWLVKDIDKWIPPANKTTLKWDNDTRPEYDF